MKKILFLILGFALGISGVAYSASIFQGYQGGTGIGSATAGQKGQCLKVSDDSPFTYELGACGSGGGGTDGNWVYFNDSGIKLATTTNQVLIGASATSTGSALEVAATATSTFLGNVMVGNAANGGEFYTTGLFHGKFQSQFSQDVNDLTAQIGILNVNMGTYAATCLSLGNAFSKSSTVPGVLGTNWGNICYSGANFGAYSGLVPSGLVLLNDSGPIGLAAASTNLASSTLFFGVGSGYTSGNWDMVLQADSGGKGRLGIGTTSPGALFSMAKSAGNTTSAVWISTTTSSNATSTAFIIDSTGKVGIGTSSPKQQLVVEGNGYFAQNVGINMSSPSYQLTQKSTAALETAPISTTELTDDTGWTSTNWTGDYTTGFTHSTGNTSALSRAMIISANTLYQVSVTVTGRTAGSFTIALGYATSTYTMGDSNATFTFGPQTLATGANAPLTFTPTSSFNGTLSSISVKAITGTYDPVYAILDKNKSNTFEIRSSPFTYYNNFQGYNSGEYNTTGIYNSSQGYSSLSSNTTGERNAAQGVNALRFNTAGGYNSAQGYGAMYSNTTGSYNAGQGYATLYLNTIGTFNSAQGMVALYSNVSGNYNTAQGAYSLYNNTTANNNSAQGYGALYTNTTGSNNVAYGYDALYTNNASFNSSVGSYSLQLTTTGTRNSAVGYSSLLNNTTGGYNSALGMWTLYNNLSATNTVAIGYKSAYGTGAYSNQGGVYVGYQSGLSAGTGSDYNTLLGYQSGYSLSTGYGNIVIGANVEAPSNTGNNQLNIGNLLYGTGVYSSSGSSPVLSSAAVSGAKFGISTTTPFAKLSIAGDSSGTMSLFAVSTSTASATSTAFIIDANGKVGVGTTSPYTQLSVQDGVAAQYFNADNANATSTFAGGLSVAGSTGLTVLQNGRVGIGTTSPVGALHIDNNNVSTLTQLRVTNSISTSYSQLRISNDSTDEISFYSLGSGMTSSYAGISSANLGMLYYGGKQALLFDVSGAYPMAFATNGLERMRISSTGLVGIGTTSPYAKLSVTNYTATTPTMNIFAPNNGTKNVFMVATTTGTATSTAFVIDSNGKIGVGTSSPSTQLSVVGNIYVDNTFSLGIGSSSPYAQLSINALAQTTPYFAIGSSTEVFKILPSSSSSLSLGTTTTSGAINIGGTDTASSTIMWGGKFQIDTYDNGGARRCVFMNSAGTLTTSSGACNQ